MTWITFGLCLIHTTFPYSCHCFNSNALPCARPAVAQELVSPCPQLAPWYYPGADATSGVCGNGGIVVMVALMHWKGYHIFKNCLLKRCSKVGRDFPLQLLLQVWLSHSIAKCHLSFSASSVSCLTSMFFFPFCCQLLTGEMRNDTCLSASVISISFPLGLA